MLSFLRKGKESKDTILAWLQPTSGKFAERVSNLEKQYVWMIVLLHLQYEAN